MHKKYNERELTPAIKPKIKGVPPINIVNRGKIFNIISVEKSEKNEIKPII